MFTVHLYVLSKNDEHFICLCQVAEDFVQLPGDVTTVYSGHLWNSHRSGNCFNLQSPLM